MNYILSIILSFLFLSFAAMSQNGFSISPEYFDDVYNEDLSDVSYLRFEAFMENGADSTLNINWEIVNIDLPLEWGLSVSDKDMSYPPGPQIITTNGNPVALDAGETDIPFNVDVYPKQVSGCGIFDVLITLDESGLVLDTIEYEISINDDDCLINTVGNHYLDKKVEIFPNPFLNHLRINAELSIHHITIYNSHGSALATRLKNFHVLNVSDLERGIYYLELVFENGQKLIRKIVHAK